jgi:hypothetical protein
MNPSKAAKIADSPAAILRFERDLQTYESRTGRAFPEEWKSPTFLRILPDSHQEELVRRFQLGMKHYEDLVANVRGFSQEVWFSTKGPSEMDVDSTEYEKKGFDWQGWIQTASWEDMTTYWEQQHQWEEDVDYLGKPKGGKGGMRRKGASPTKGGGAAWVETRKCHWCDLPGHLVRDCPAKRDGKPQRPAFSAKVGAKAAAVEQVPSTRTTRRACWAESWTEAHWNGSAAVSASTAQIALRDMYAAPAASKSTRSSFPLVIVMITRRRRTPPTCLMSQVVGETC